MRDGLRAAGSRRHGRQREQVHRIGRGRKAGRRTSNCYASVRGIRALTGGLVAARRGPGVRRQVDVRIRRARRVVRDIGNRSSEEDELDEIVCECSAPTASHGSVLLLSKTFSRKTPAQSATAASISSIAHCLSCLTNFLANEASALIAASIFRRSDSVGSGSGLAKAAPRRALNTAALGVSSVTPRCSSISATGG